MYTIFINDLSLHIAETAPSDAKIFTEEVFLEFDNWFALLEAMGSGECWLLSKAPDRAMERFQSAFKIIEAAGGFVLNTNSELLVIHRLGKWDLPKGKVESEEAIPEAAVREVEEECGITDLEIIEPLPSTFHTYRLKGQRIFKKTHWFVMKTGDTSIPVPQSEEDILEAVWMERSQWDKVYSNTYPSILFLLNTYVVRNE